MGRACPRFMGGMSQVPGLSAARGGSLGSPGCAFEAVTRVLKVFNPKPGILGCDMIWKRIWDADWHCRIFKPQNLGFLGKSLFICMKLIVIKCLVENSRRESI